MSEEFGDPRDDLLIRDGEARCPNENCEYWVPEGMEYLYLHHYQSHSGDDDDSGVTSERRVPEDFEELMEDIAEYTNESKEDLVEAAEEFEKSVDEAREEFRGGEDE